MDEIRTKQADEKFCESCGSVIKRAAEICPKCGVRQQPSVSPKSWIATLLLLIFLPTIHRFYVGKIGTGILFLLTIGGLGVWFIIDLIMIIAGKFTDSQGRVVTR